MTLEPRDYRWAGGRVAALLGFDLWLAGPLVAIGLVLAVGPSFYTFLVSLVWQPPTPSKMPQPPKSFPAAQVKIHSFSHSTTSIGLMTFLITLFPSPFLFLDPKILSQALPKLCSQHFPV